MSKYGVISSPNTGKYRPEVTPYFGHFLRSEYIKKNTEVSALSNSDFTKEWEDYFKRQAVVN